VQEAWAVRSCRVYKLKNTLAISLVSHGHGDMVWRLVSQLVVCPEVAQIIVTLNIPEAVPGSLDGKVLLVQNQQPQGFGENHNAAFALANGGLYCVINPDIELVQNPFAALMAAFSDQRVGLVAPLVVGSNGFPEDSMRRFLTPWSMAKRALGVDSGAYSLRQGSSGFTPDWVAGMFMLFRSEAYAKVGGFDERYFMYCEDADICTRLWKAGYKVVGCLSVNVIHNAQRASHRSFKHLSWHLRSMARYFLSHSFSLPKKNEATLRS
jgi:N-acetylglucosaminyl-diphospho-decaprenol L-rhamnosyltransferase